MAVIRAETIAEGIPARLKAFLYPDSPALPMVAMLVIEAFWEAATLIEKVARLDKKVVIMFFGTRPFKVNLKNGTLVYTPNDDVISVHINDVIYIDYPGYCNLIKESK